MFVDDEPRILQGLRRMLRGHAKEWDMTFVEGGPAALERLAGERFQVLVTDMRMPVLDGAALLEKVRELSPTTVRIVLSGHSADNSLIRSLGVAHQHLAKPVTQEELEQVLETSLGLSELLADPALVGLLSQVDSLPSLPQILQQLLEIMESPDCSLKQVGELVASDMGLTTTVLKVVNSAYFGMSRTVTEPAQAVNLLGLDTIKALALSHHLFSSLGTTRLAHFSNEWLWSHCLQVGGFAKALAQAENWCREEAGQAFLSGMLHDVGKLTMIAVDSGRYAQVVEETRRGKEFLYRVEKEFLGTTHAEVGAYILGLWGFHPTVVRAIGGHHQPSAAGGRLDLLTLVHVADVLEHELVVKTPEFRIPELDAAYLAAVGVVDRVAKWREACRALIS